MTEIDNQRLRDLYSKFEAGECLLALQELRDMTKGVDDPWDKAELAYHETIFLVEMSKIQEARLHVDDLKKAVAILTDQEVDGYEVEVRTGLPLMVRYAELEVTIAEGKEQEALRLLEELESSYPKQLATPGFRRISDTIETYHGFLLADAGRWTEARPFLERAVPPNAWKSVLSYYLGHYYYEKHEYKRARGKLVEALGLRLEGRWEGRAHYVLGLVEYHFGNIEAAKQQFELCAKTADPEYLAKTEIWEGLESTSRQLGLLTEAKNYRKLRTNSLPKSKMN